MQRFGIDPFDGEHFVAETERHQDAADEGLAALGLARESNQLATGETGPVLKPEEELHLRQLRIRADAPCFQLLQPLFILAGETGQCQFLPNERDGFGVHGRKILRDILSQKSFQSRAFHPRET